MSTLRGTRNDAAIPPFQRQMPLQIPTLPETVLTVTASLMRGLASGARRRCAAGCGRAASPGRRRRAGAAPAARSRADQACVATIDGKPITEADLELAADRSRPAVRPAAGRAAARRRPVGAHRDPAAGRQGATPTASTRPPDFQRRMEFLRERALHSAATSSKSRRQGHRRGGARPLRQGNRQHAAGQRGACPSHPGEDQGRGARRSSSSSTAAPTSQKLAKEKSTDPSGKTQRRRSRLFRPGPDGAGIREGGVRARASAHTPRSRCRRQFGWHVIKVEDKRAQQPPAFDQVKDQVRQLVLRDKYFALVKRCTTSQGRHRRSRARRRRRAAAGEAAAGSRSSSDCRRRLDAGRRMRRSRLGQTGGSPRVATERPMSSAVSPLAPKTYADAAGDRRRAHRHRRGRHQIQEPHRPPADGVRQPAPGGRRLHPLEMPVGAGRLLPRESGRRQGPRRWSSIPAMPTPSPAARPRGDGADRAGSGRAPSAAASGEVFLASTGVIGEPLDAEPFRASARRHGAEAEPGRSGTMPARRS